MKAPLKHARLIEVLSYNEATGEFRWRQYMNGRATIGKRAGSVTKQGYVVIRVDGVQYKAHRLAWFYVHQQWPAEDVDHRSHERANNRIVNLRSVTRKVNNQNVVRPLSRSQSGILGVSKFRNRWRATIGVNGGKKHLGTFDTPEEAGAAYLAAKRRLHEGNTL